MQTPAARGRLRLNLDDDATALSGKLGRCNAPVQEAFRRIDALVFAVLGTINRAAISRNGAWFGRSYMREETLLLRIDPKEAFLRVQVGREDYAAAPYSLKDEAYAQDDWLIVRPSDVDVGIDYLSHVLRSRRLE